MKVLVAPLEFKGLLSADEAARAIGLAITQSKPQWTVDLAPLADGGPGTLDAVLAVVPGARVDAEVHDALGAPVHAQFADLGGGVALVEMAQASGLSRLSREQRNAPAASTFGCGELIRAALDRGAHHVIVGAGGSATTDGGSGALTALGARLLDEALQPIPPGGAGLIQLRSMDLSQVHPALREGTATLQVATDVQNPLVGPSGAAHVFAPQKGATPTEVIFLDRVLGQLADVFAPLVGGDLRDVPGSGAAGGLAFGLASLNAALRRQRAGDPNGAAAPSIIPGFALVAALIRLDERIRRADLVITGEGSLDVQSRYGKGPWELAHRARAAGRKVVCIAGRIKDASAAAAFDDTVESSPEQVPANAVIARERLIAATRTLISRIAAEREARR